MNLKEFVEQNEFSKGLPEGKTIFELDKCTAREEKVKDDSGKDRTTWIIDDGNKEVYVPASVMTGIKNASKEGKGKVEVVRNGVGLQTKYTVTGV